MYLLIDLSEKDTIHLALFNEDTIEHKKSSGRNRELLVCIDDFIREQTLDKKEVAGIMVVVGAGGFTSTRVGAVVANAFVYAEQIPVLAIQQDQIDSIQELIPALLKQPKGQYISATYSGEPNIGGSQ